MNKYVGFIFRAVPYIAINYPGILNNSIHKDKISRIKRYKDNRRVVSHVVNDLHIEIKVTGLEKLPADPAFLLTPNHQSFMDALCLITAINQPLSFVAKKETKSFPVVGRIITSLDSKFLDRENLRQEIKVMQEIKASLKSENKKWVIFPEGTRTKDENHALGEFKAGAFKSAQSAGVNIYPVAMWGSYRALDKKVKNYRRFPVYISILDPLTSEMYKDMNTNQISEYVKDKINQELEILKVRDKEEEKLYKKR